MDGLTLVRKLKVQALVSKLLLIYGPKQRQKMEAICMHNYASKLQYLKSYFFSKTSSHTQKSTQPFARKGILQLHEGSRHFLGVEFLENAT